MGPKTLWNHIASSVNLRLFNIIIFVIWPAFIWRIFLEKKNSADCILKQSGWWKFAFSEAHKFSRQIVMFSLELPFISYSVFRRQLVEFFFSKKFHQMKAGQYNIHSTNPIKILQSHAPQQSPPSKQFSSLFRFPLHILSPINGFSGQTFCL